MIIVMSVKLKNIICNFFLAISIQTSLHLQTSFVRILNSLNFSMLAKRVCFSLEILDLDFIFMSSKPSPINESSTKDERKLFKKLERSNKLSLIFIQMTIV